MSTGTNSLEKGRDYAMPAERQLTKTFGRRYEIVIVLAFALLVTLPFIFRPVHMDDAGFIEFARARQEQSMEIQLHDYTFFGQENELFIDTHPPLISSYLALLMTIAGSESVVLLHLGFLIFPLIAAASMYYLARFFTRYAMMAALLLMATPGVIVMSHGLMSDMPGLSMWLAGIALYLYGLKRRSLGLMVLCAFAITLGVFISYQTMSVIPLLLAYAIMRRRFSLLAVLPLVLPLSSFFSYSAWHYTIVGFFPRFSYGVGAPLAWYSVVQKGGYAMLVLGGAVIFFGIIMVVTLKKTWDVVVYLAFLVPLLFSFAAQYLTGRYSAAAVLLAVLFMPLGILLVYQLYADGLALIKADRSEWRSQTVFLLLWLTGVMFYVVLLLPYSSVRYLLPAFPPLVLLFIRLVENRYMQDDSRVKQVLLAGVITTAVVGLTVAVADFELARANREFACNEAHTYIQKAEDRGNQAWFVGEFGFRYYMEQQGLKELPKDTDLPDGDLIIQSPVADPRRFSEELADRVELIAIVPYESLFPLRTLSFDDNAGFYGHFWGLLPYSLSLGSVEEYLVYEVEAPPSDDDGGELGNESS